MKKIISLLITAVMLVLCLASCESGVGDFQYDYNPVRVKEISLNMYIICDDDCSPIARTTVADDIADYTERNYKTKVNVIYKTASEYKAAVTAAVTSTDDQIKAGIVLINSKELMDELMEDEALLDLTTMYASKAYGTLNAQINSALLEASKYVTTPDNPDTTDVNEEVKGLYTVPNNRVLGAYTYLLIDKAAAKAGFATSEGDWNAIKTLEEAEAVLPAGSYSVVTGSYNTRFQYDKSVYYFNEATQSLPIIGYPTVTAEDAFASAFAVVSGGAIPKTAEDAMTDEEFVSRAMQIIYSINTDSYVRNTLQYGRENSNYVVANGSYDKDGNLVENGGYDVIKYDPDDESKTVIVPNGYVVPKVTSQTSYYKMNLEYTGDVFKADKSYYPEENYGWSIDDYNDGLEQNKDVRVG